jgi:hypothetical protein
MLRQRLHAFGSPSLTSESLTLLAFPCEVELSTDCYLSVSRYILSVPRSGGDYSRHRPYVSRIMTKASIISYPQVGRGAANPAL